ncbi:hypothetical protein IW140_005506 [Coemansia sp. RSA 1813]|nr:hypothetical protein EV179_004614 [Coemansia sp. RSA 487]KAJ2565036.1 hypothetical protein IW140_005506 [Coemansia sp. RSA 1813]
MKRVRGSDVGGRAAPGSQAFDLAGVRMPPLDDPQGKARKIPQRSRMFGLPDAPTFYPSAEEFTDPLEYIQRIRPEAEKAGICKIVPPAGWNPPFSLDTKRFRFKTRIQQLNSLEGKTRTNLNYLDQLYKFHSQQGNPLTKVPQLDHRPIDLYDLRNEVATRGGYKKVNGEKRWAEIGRVLKYDRKTCTSMSNTLKSSYQKIILPFEMYVAKHGGSLPPTPRRSAADGPADGILDSPEGPGMRRSKRRRSSRNVLTDNTSQSPISAHVRSPSTEATDYATPATDTHTSAGTRSSKMSAEGASAMIPDQCEVCKSGEDDESMLICDGCDRGFHMYCLNPPLSSIPRNDWYCDACVLGTSADFGFEDGAEYSLESFKRKCDEFKRTFFASYYGDSSQHGSQAAGGTLWGPQMEGRVPEDVVEREFWRLVASPYEDVEVEYGADLHSAQHGSGFPTAERNPLEPYARHPWNLNVMPFERQSLFNYIQQDISGMMTPWIYAGMCFSTFCWHNEDHYTYSVNYMHWGDTKTWYGVPGHHAEAFEAAMRDAVPQLFEDQPDLLFQLVTMLSPEVLVRRGVDVTVCDQRAGEFVVTFPQAYHAGFNQGLNFNEAVNFATPDWMPYDVGSIRRYQQYARNPVFSHDELLMTMCAADAGFMEHAWFQVAVHEMVSREMTGRAQVRSKWGRARIREVPWDEVEEGDPDMPEDMRQQCYTCKAFSFLSAVVCDCSPNYIACLLHPEMSCKCDVDQKILKIRHTDEELQGLLSKCKVRGFLARSADIGEAGANNANAADAASPTSKAQVWEEEFRRVMSLYANSSKPNANNVQSVASSTATTVVPPAASSVARGLSESDDSRSLGAASTQTSDSAVSPEDASAADAAAASQNKTEIHEDMDIDVPQQKQQQQQQPQATMQTMTVAALNRRPDLTQMVLLLEEAQRLVLHDYESSVSERLVKEESSSIVTRQQQSTTTTTTTPTRRGRPRGRGRGRGRKRGRGRPPSNAVPLATDHASSSRNGADGAGMMSANGDANIDDEDEDEDNGSNSNSNSSSSSSSSSSSDAWVVMLGREIEQIMATCEEAPGKWQRTATRQHGSNSGAPEESSMTRLNSTVDMQILGDVRQLSRFVQRAQEWCRAAQALLACTGRQHAVDRVVAKHKANYAWHKDKLRKRFGDLLQTVVTADDVSAELVTPMIPLSLSSADAPIAEHSASVTPTKSSLRRHDSDSETVSDTSTNDQSDDTDYNESDNFVASASARRSERGRGSGRRGRYPAGRRGAAPGGNGTPRRGPGRPPKSAVARVAQTPSRPVGRPRKHPRPTPTPTPQRAQSLGAIPVAGPFSSAAKRKSTEPPFSASLVANMSTGELVAVIRRFLGTDGPDDDVALDEHPFTPIDLKQLLEAGDQLYFSSPEFQELIDLEVEALKAELSAQEAISGAPEATRRLAHIPGGADDLLVSAMKSDKSKDQLQTDTYIIHLRAAETSLRATGLRFLVERELIHIAETAEWCVFARHQLLMHHLTAEELHHLAQEAKRIGINEQIELCARLVALDRNVCNWTADAQDIIDARQSMDLRNVAKLLEKGRNLEVMPDNLKKLRNLQQKALDLQVRIGQMIDRMESDDLVQRPRYSDAMLLSRACADFGYFEPSQLDSLNTAVKKAYYWSKDVEQLFAAMASFSGQPLENVFTLVQHRLQTALEIANGSKTSDNASNQMNCPPEAVPLYCICLRPEHGLMVECEHCSEWYHAQCMNLREEDINDKPYVCPLCQAEQRGEKPQPPTEYPSEGRIQRAIDDGRALHLVSNALDPLVTILLDSRALSDSIRDVCENKQLIYGFSRSASRKKKSMRLLLPADIKQMRVKLLRTLIRALLGLGVNLKRALLDDLWLELLEAKEALSGTTTAPAIPTPTSANSVDAVTSFTAPKNISDTPTSRAQTLPLQSPGYDGSGTDNQELIDGGDNSEGNKHIGAPDGSFLMVVDDAAPQDEPQPVEIDEFYQRRLEELVYLIINPLPKEQDHGEALEVSGNVFNEDQENCVCHITGPDHPVVQCDSCHFYFHINCMQVPPSVARIIELHQIQRLLNVDIDADVPDSPSSYVCPNCCINSKTTYAYGEVVID